MKINNWVVWLIIKLNKNLEDQIVKINKILNFWNNDSRKIILMKSQSFGELIKKTRIQKGKALREVAADIEFDQSLLSKIYFLYLTCVYLFLLDVPFT